jgi:RNA polymerase sigma-70 factor (ECF subfamily)
MNSIASAVDQELSFGAESMERATTGELCLNLATVEDTVELRPETDDLELARMAASGNLAAFEMLYKRYYRRTFSLALRMTGSQTEAEDLTQEVFIQLFRKIGSFRGDSAFSTWLHRMTVNQVLMHFRKRSFKNEKTSEDGEMPEQTVSGTANPSRMAVIDRIALKTAINDLPKGYKSVFVLHDVEGFEHEEVARMLGISIGTSKSQLHKARLKLRNLLAKQAEESG